MLNERDVEREEDRLRDLVARLPADQRKRFHQQARLRLKDPDTYAVLNWFLVAGLHHFYLGKLWRGAVNLAVFLLGVVMFFASEPVLGLILIAGIFLIELWALFRSQVFVRHHNNVITRELLKDLGES